MLYLHPEIQAIRRVMMKNGYLNTNKLLKSQSSIVFIVISIVSSGFSIWISNHFSEILIFFFFWVIFSIFLIFFI